MASTHCYDDIKAFLQTQFAPIPVLDWDDIEPALEQRSDPFLVLEDVSGGEDIISFGDPSAICVRETGFLFVHCFVPAPESSRAARALGEQVQQAMRLVRMAGLRIVDADPPDLSAMNDGLWTAAQVAIDYDFDRHVAVP